MTAFDTSRVIWRKSTRTGAGSGGGGNCVEIGATPHLVGIRDSKLGNASPQLWLTPSDFATLLTRLRA